ncbi:MAG: CvpA family protein [Epsilonproteobacteria bacterium]|nr:MAG: CvpA family protein [Campylobacterota bacterium]
MENFTMIDFNYFDVAIAATILILAIKGFMNGFIKEIFGLAGLLVGVYLAAKLSNDAASFIEANFFRSDNPQLLQLLGFLAILIIVWLSITIIGSIVSKLTSKSGLGFLNRLLGFIAGGGKYFLIFALIVTALSNIQLVKNNLEKYIDDSLLYPHLKELGSYIIDLSPKGIGLDANNSSEVSNLSKEIQTGIDTINAQNSVKSN